MMLKKIFKYLCFLLILSVISIWAADRYVATTTEDQLYTDVSKVPQKRIGIVLGTSKYLSSGYVNYYYKFRIDAAVALYKAGKVQYIIVSGDNGTKQYNEPETMYNDLVNAGIPAHRIYMDFAGFRTLDSIVRANYIFDADDFIVISQRFHNERAIAIANFKGIKAIGFNAKDVNKKAGIKTQIREKFARVKMLIDLIFNKQPKFYGNKIKIG